MFKIFSRKSHTQRKRELKRVSRKKPLREINQILGYLFNKLSVSVTEPE